jgi:hypothetical protein
MLWFNLSILYSMLIALLLELISFEPIAMSAKRVKAMDKG